MSGPRRSDFGGGHDIVAEQPVSGLAQFFLQKAKANAKMSLAEALVSFFKETKNCFSHPRMRFSGLCVAVANPRSKAQETRTWP
jgi:hypothetical protein